MASLFDLFVSISGDNSSYKRAVKDSQAVSADFGRTIEGLAGKFAAAFSVTAIAKFAYDSGKAYEAAANTIARATGQTGAALDGLTESFRHLYQNSGRSAEEVSSGLAKVATETKLTGKALEDLTAANMRFAKVTNSEVGAVVEQTQVLFQNWGIETRDQAAALDVLYKTMTTAGMGMSDLSSQMTDLGPVIRAFKLSFVQTAALVGAFDDAGLRAGDMVKGLSTLFGKFQKAGEDPVKALQNLIDRLRDTHTRGAALAELIESGLRPALAIKLADAAARGGLAIDDYVKKLQGAPGSVKEVADKTTSLSEELTKLTHKLQDGATARGGFLDWLKGVVHSMNEVAGKGGIAALFGGGWAAGKILSDNEWTISQGTIGGPKPGESLNKPAPGAGMGGGLGSHSYTIMASAEVDILNAALDRAKRAFLDFWTASEEGGKKLHGAIEATADDLQGDLVPIMKDWQTIGLEATIDVAQSFDESLSPAIRNTEAAIHSLGIASLRELRAQYDAAMAAAQAMVINGAGVADVGAAMERVAALHKELSQRMGKWTDETRVNVRTLGQELVQMTHRMFDNISRSIARNLVDWKGWGESLKNIVKTIADDVLNILISSLLKPLEDRLGKMLGKIGGGGGSVASSAGGSAGGAGSGAASGAATGVMGTIGAVSAAVGAVSSVIGNFQMAGMNKSLDVLVNHTLRIFNELYQFRADAWSRHTGLLQKLDDLWRTNLNIYDLLGKGGGVGGGRGGVQVNFYGPVNGNPDAIAQSIFDRLALANG